MTGAPKIRAMEIIDEVEVARRGPYCGTIAWLGFDGAMDSSVVIRTLVITPEAVVAQAGGGIVADSEPSAEYEEMMVKVRPLLAALNSAMTLWLNGALSAPERARIDPADRGLTLGDGLFETIRLAEGRPLHLARHLTRLRDGALLLAIPVPYDDAAIAGAIAAVAAGLVDAAIRVTLTRGPAPRGVLPPDLPTPTLLITAGRLPAAGPVRLVVSRITRRNEGSPLSRIKSLNYLDSVLARQEAARNGADDALLLNSRGAIAEATAANLFLRRGGTLATPPVSDGALPGVMRSVLIDRCKAVERTLFPADVYAADAAFLANSLGLRAVLALEGRTVGSGVADLQPLIDTVATTA